MDFHKCSAGNREIRQNVANYIKAAGSYSANIPEYGSGRTMTMVEHGVMPSDSLFGQRERSFAHQLGPAHIVNQVAPGIVQKSLQSE
jgi:hypothetical protein